MPTPTEARDALATLVEAASSGPPTWLADGHGTEIMLRVSAWDVLEGLVRVRDTVKDNPFHSPSGGSA